MFVLELPAGGSTSPQRHVYEEIYYVLEGRGSTQLEFTDGRRRSFEWGPHSFFAIPLNAKHRHFNGSGTQRALMCTTTLLPLMMKVLHNERFIFDNDFEFDERIGKDEYFAGNGDLRVAFRASIFGKPTSLPTLRNSSCRVVRSRHRLLACRVCAGRRHHARAHV